MVMPTKRSFRELDDFGGVMLTSPAHDVALATKPPNTHLEWLGAPVNAWVPVENGYYIDEQQNKVKGANPKYAPVVAVKPPTITTSPLATQTRPLAVFPWWDQMWADFLKFFGVK